MIKWNRFFAFVTMAALLLAGCGNQVSAEQASDEPQVETTLPQIDATKWNYNAEDGVYWQVGIAYCENPADLTYETLGIFVPEAYMTAEENGDGTYTCTINTNGTAENYTAQTAPIVIPVNTPGYMAMEAPTEYVEAAADYTDAGFIYVNAGCRGRDAGAPYGVTDLKAAVRYIRYNDGNVPGCTERIFTFGMSGGGAQSALMGATGDSELYTPYLEAIGAVEGVSDAIAGAMAWCPITSLDYADATYEWNMGVTRTGLTEDMQTLSDDLARAFADYINELGLTDAQGNLLTLTESEEGIYQAGTYYEYIKTEIEQSLNHFLSDTTFPYTPDTGKKSMGGQHPMMGDAPNGDGMRGGGFVDENGQMQNDGIQRNDTEQQVQEAVTYETAQDYIDSLNEDTTWILYDSTTNTAEITSIADFAQHCKQASKDIGAFDALDASQGENTLFGYGDGTGAHFDAVMAALLQNNDTYGEAYADDLEKQDALGNTVQTRVNMYNPLYYLCDYYEGYQTSTVAPYWRIRTGISQSDTALSTEINLALALESYGCTVDFETVWAQQHTMAERTGTSTENFIAWVNDCLTQG